MGPSQKWIRNRRCEHFSLSPCRWQKIRNVSQGGKSFTDSILGLCGWRHFLRSSLESSLHWLASSFWLIEADRLTYLKITVRRHSLPPLLQFLECWAQRALTRNLIFFFFLQTRPGTKDTFSVTYNPETKWHLVLKSQTLILGPLSPFYRRGNWGSEELGNLSRVIWPVGREGETKSNFFNVNSLVVSIFFFSLDCNLPSSLPQYHCGSSEQVAEGIFVLTLIETLTLPHLPLCVPPLPALR